MATDKQRLILGALALGIGSVLIMASGLMNTPLPSGTSALAALVITAGTLLVGLSEKGADV